MNAKIRKDDVSWFPSLLCLCTVFALAVGCASKGAIKVSSPVSVKLADYRKLALNVSSEVEKSSDQVVKLGNLIQQKLREKNLFERIYLASSAPEETADLQLEVKILKMREVSATTRILFGAFAGRSKLLADVRLVDIKTGSEIGAFQAEGKSSGGTIFAGTTDQAIERVAEQIADFVQKNS